MAITTIAFDPRIDLPSGNLSPAPVTLKATPTRIREVGTQTVYPETVTFAAVTADTPIHLQSTDSTWAWTIGAYRGLRLIDIRTVFVTGTNTNWVDLVDVDPDTFLPAVPGTTVGQQLDQIKTRLTSIEDLAAATTTRLDTVDSELDGLRTTITAPLDSPNFTGIPTVPTAAPGSATTQAASTAFVNTAITAVINAIVAGAPTNYDTLAELAAAFTAGPQILLDNDGVPYLVGTTTPSTVSTLLTETGDALLTETGDLFILDQISNIGDALLTETGDSLTTENSDLILT